MKFLFTLLTATVLLFISVMVGESASEADLIDLPANARSAFIPNKGQWDEEVRFLTKWGGMNAWITDRGIVFDFYHMERNEAHFDNIPGGGVHDVFNEQYEVRRFGHVVKMSFEFSVEANPIFRPYKQNTTHYNYFLGSDPSRWAQNVPVYNEVITGELYPGIDIRYYYDADGSGLRYDFIVQPGARVEDIVFTLEGVNEVRVNDDGDLSFMTSLGEVRHRELFAYQEIDGDKIEVPGSFHLRENGNIGFIVHIEDEKEPLIIDPLISSTFLGGSGSGWPGDRGTDLMIGSDGNVYVTGRTVSDDFPSTTGAYDETFNGVGDAFVSVMNSDLSELIYSTFLGGSNDGDWGFSLTLDADGNVYVTGHAASNDFPTTSGAFDETYNGGRDIFVSALSPDLSELLFSTYLGGNANEAGSSIIIDPDGVVYITGGTASANFPTTPDAFDVTREGESDVFISALSPDLSELLYSTLIGGSVDEWPADHGASIAIGNDGTVYVTGFTPSSDFPTMSGAYDETFNRGEDVFVSAFSYDLSELKFSTFLGGNGNELGRSLSIDSYGRVYIMGRTGSSNFPTTPDSYDQVYNGGQFDVFVSVLSPDLSQLLYSTYLGGSSVDHGFKHILDADGNVYLTGSTGSDDFPTTPDAYDGVHNGSRDAFVGILSSDLSELRYSTFLGGSGDDWGYSIALDTERNVFITGQTGSSDFPTTPGAYDETYNGGNDVFVSKFNHTIVSVTDKATTYIPQKYALHQNYPNPFNSSTTIRFGLPEAIVAQLTVYDILGRKVETLVDGYKDAGYYEAVFDAGDLSSGVYLYQLRAGEFVETKRLLLLK